MAALSIKHRLLIMLFLACLILLAFGRSLNGYFLADEAWCLPLIWRGFHGEPGLIWGQFAAPYTYRESLYIFYRPLVIIGLAIDFLIWNVNPLGYHITDLGLHWINTCLVFWASRLFVQVLSREVQSGSGAARSSIPAMPGIAIPLMVSAAFAVYPGQAEAVCWTGARIDTQASMFYFASLIAIVKYRLARNNKWWFPTAWICMLLGLLTKESCVTIPFVMAAILFYLDSGDRPSTWSAHSFRTRWRGAVCTLSMMFVLLIVYLIVRTWALQTPIGGYTGSFAFLLSKTLISRLLDIKNLLVFLYPINEQVPGTNSFQDLCLRGVYLALGVLLVANLNSTRCIKLRLKASAWLAVIGILMALPSLLLWGPNSALMGTRLAYPILFPALLAIVLLIHPLEIRKPDLSGITGVRTQPVRHSIKWLRDAGTIPIISYVVLTAFLLVSISISSCYARLWSDTSRTVDSMRRQIVEAVDSLPPGGKIVLLNLPSFPRGVVMFFSTDFLPGFLRPGLTDRDISDRVICADGAPLSNETINFSGLENLISTEPAHQFLLWLPDRKHFAHIAFPKSSEIQASDKRALKAVRSQIDSRQTLAAVHPPVMPFDVTSVEIAIDYRKCGRQFPPGEAILSWHQEAVGSNGQLLVDSGPEVEPDTGLGSRSVRFPLNATEGTSRYRINLSEHKGWVFSGPTNTFRLSLPEAAYEVKSFVLRSSDDDFIPSLSLKEAGTMSTSGLLECDAGKLRFLYDASRIPGATHVIFEISPPYLQFNIVSGTFRDRVAAPYSLHALGCDRLSGEFVVAPALLPKQGYYEFRVAALDEEGKVIGSFSDPVAISTVKDERL